MDKTSMLESLINHYTNGNKAAFALKIGAKPQTVSAWISRNTFDSEQIYAHCENISAEWLLTGEGEMISGDKQSADDCSEEIKYLRTENASLKAELCRIKELKLPTRDSKIYNLWMKFMEITEEMQELYKEEKGD